MWWSCFSYDKNGPSYIYRKETDVVRKAREAKAKAQVQEWNDARKDKDKEAWNLTKPMSRLRIRGNVPGTKPTFRHTPENRAYS
jgi:hypothetical protein